MAKKNNKQTKETKIHLIVISLILIIIGFIINKVTFIRPLLFIISIIIISITISMEKTHKMMTAMLTFIIGIIISILIDGIIVFTFKIIPVFSYNIITYENIKVYNSLGIRVWQCDKTNPRDLIIDPFYKNGYMCDISSTDATDINSFLNSVIENYDSYKNNYIKLEGKISRKNSRNLIEMKPYEENSITVNGYVTFSENITLKVIFNKEEPVLDNYDIYDDIVVVGVIKNIENNNGNYTIYMSDSKVLSDINLNDYILTITPSTTCKEDILIFSNDNMKVYTHCIDDIIIDYTTKKYELSTSLSSGKISIKELYDSPSKKEQNDELDTIYYNEDYNVIVCNSENSKDIIIGNSSMSFDDVTCNRVN